MSKKKQQKKLRYGNILIGNLNILSCGWPKGEILVLSWRQWRYFFKFIYAVFLQKCWLDYKIMKLPLICLLFSFIEKLIFFRNYFVFQKNCQQMSND